MNWKTVEDEPSIQDVGARLLANIAKGIYNHEAVLREYVQNAGDAIAHLSELDDGAVDDSIQIRILDGKSLEIHDNGIGMDLQDIKDAKRIAVSGKGELDRAGFRGIGTWAGLQACERLELVTTKFGETTRFRLTIDFAEMLPDLEKNIHIGELLAGRYRIEESTALKEEHYTSCRLVNVMPDYRALLNNQEVKRIVSQILPCKFDPGFEHAKKVEAELRMHADGFQQYTIKVDDDEVFKHFPTGLPVPQTEVIKQDGVDYAFAWFCTGTERIKANAAKFESNNFRLRVKNIAIGAAGAYSAEDASEWNLKKMLKLKSPETLGWHVGEIHITNSALRPDTPRSGFEIDSQSRPGIEAIRGFYEDRIADARATAESKKFIANVEKAAAIRKDPSKAETFDIKTIYDSLVEQERLSKQTGKSDLAAGKKAPSKVTTKLRSRLRATALATERKKSIPILKKLVAAAERAQKDDPQNNGNRRKASRNRDSGEAAVNAEPNAEKLLSDVLAVIESMVDDDTVESLSSAVQDVFKQHGFIE
ncbi:MAG: hypothetical protein QOH01_3149 [Verrucomicrobiota bacterium]|jgi:hypothetical protein